MASTALPLILAHYKFMRERLLEQINELDVLSLLVTSPPGTKSFGAQWKGSTSVCMIDVVQRVASSLGHACSLVLERTLLDHDKN